MKFVNSLTDNKTFHQAVKVNNERLTEENLERISLRARHHLLNSAITVEIRKAEDELCQLSEMDVKAFNKQRKRRAKEK
ncbi:hypothetical protein EVAR_52647_1 [Eumeta japonica]|uniref:Uncharacterized protein n=1 Tax=Eumeta variegata TaxID=151549 RepID=A0A4C1XY12_EUMVA|nr:hypothetical protein EVAR_52647_1 [Eumeta japonica]